MGEEISRRSAPGRAACLGAALAAAALAGPVLAGGSGPEGATGRAGDTAAAATRAAARAPAPAAIPFVGGGRARIDAVRRLPGSGLSVVESAGTVFFLTANGRYALRGEAWDLWNRRPIRSVADAAAVAGRIDLAAMGLEVEALAHLDLGSGRRDVVAFLDPRCRRCREVLAEMKALAEKEPGPAGYRFRIVPLPVMGSESQALVKRLGCLGPEEREAGLAALLAGRYEGLAPERPGCDLGALQRTLITAQLLGIRAVPYLIAPDGRIAEGRLAPGGLRAWLEGGGDE